MVDAITGAPPGVLRAASPTPRPAAPAAAADGGSRFRELLAATERTQIEFSKHALRRIEQRGLPLDGERLLRLERAVSRAHDKGSRDSLILLDELALVVSVRSHTVVTAMDRASGREQVFTNIDSVVIAG